MQQTCTEYYPSYYTFEIWQYLLLQAQLYDGTPFCKIEDISVLSWKTDSKSSLNIFRQTCTMYQLQ